MGIILIGLIVVLFSFFIVIYNRLVRLRFHVREAWSDIDVQLKRRHDLIPNVQQAVKGYMQYEKNLLENITNMRSKVINTTATVKDTSMMENSFTSLLKNFFGLVEAYPDLKASQNVRDLQKTLIDIEDHIQYARRYYNGTVRNFNILIKSFPSNLIANAFNFKQAEFFEIEYATEREVPDVKL